MLRLYQPEFRSASELITAARLVNPGADGVLEPATPWVAVAGGKARAPTRILLAGSAAELVQAEAVLRRFDLPDPMVRVDLTVSEVRCAGRSQSGGHLLYDRSADPGAQDTLFRGTASTFEPDSYLRGQLVGLTPFQGTSLTFGRVEAGDGLFEYVLRALSERHESETLACTTLVCTESSPAELASLLSVSSQRQSVRSSLDLEGGTSKVTLRTELAEAGLYVRVVPVRIGADGAVLDLVVRLRTAEPSNDPDQPSGSLVTRSRQLVTRLLARDGETLVVGGLRLRRRLGDRRGLPLLDRLAGLDRALSARGTTSEVSELLFVLRPRILALGRGPLSAEPPAPQPALQPAPGPAQPAR